MEVLILVAVILGMSAFACTLVHERELTERERIKKNNTLPLD